MKKWKAVIAGLVLILSLSAAAACGTNRKNEPARNPNGVTTENNGTGVNNGNTNGTGVNNGTTNGTVNGTDVNNGTGVNNGTTNGTGVTEGMGTENRVDTNGNPISDVVEGVGEAGKDIINGVENGVNDMTNNTTTENTNNTTNKTR